MKKIFIILIAVTLLLSACGNTADVAEIEEPEKRTEMSESGVNLYLQKLTGKYSSAYTIARTKEDKMKYLNEAITDINLAVYEIEDEYEEGTPPTKELLELAEHLLDIIDYEMLGENTKAYDSSYQAGIIIGELSDEYLDGELPIGIKLMIEN